MRMLLLLLAFGAVASAQEFRASISGSVTDSSAAPVPNCKVVVTNVATNGSSEAASGEGGRYVVSFLVPGTYSVTVEHTGFKKFIRENVVLGVSDRLGLDIALQVGQLNESVTVSANVSLLQTESATRVAFIEKNLIQKVPNNGRNPFLLTHALPGVTKTGYWGSAELYAYGQVGGVSISGGKAGENETVIDGVTDTRPGRGVNFIPALDSLAEISVQTNVYDAQYARTGGGVNVFSTKSGTNSIHGAMYWHLKHEKFNAAEWEYNKLVGAAVAANPNTPYPNRKFRNNTFGFEFDGPVFIPKVFDGRNKMFFMLSFEGLRELRPSGQIRTIPLPEQLGGDFSNLRDRSGNAVLIYDPLTTDATTGIRIPFVGNRIPGARVNPIASKVLSYLPKANTVGESAAQLNNFANTDNTHNEYSQWIGRLDYRIGSKNNVYFRYGQTPWFNFAQIVWGTNEAEPSGEAPSTRSSSSWAADWTSTLTPTLVLNVRAGLSRTYNFGGNIFGVGFDPRKLGFDSNLVSQYSFLQFPRFNFSGSNYSSLGTSPSSTDASDSYSFQPNISWVLGKHVLRIGTEFRRYNQNNIGPGNASGVYDFTKNWSQRDARRGDALSGNEIATFLLGYPSSGSIDRNISPANRFHYYSGYIQDDWKVTQRLTLNLGFRWDYEAPVAERYNRMINDFALDKPAAISAPGLTLTRGLVYAGTGGNARQAFNRDLNNFAPRLGVAFKILDKLVFRGGYGLVSLGQYASGPADGFSRSTPVTNSIDGGLTPRLNIANAFPEGLLQPVGSSLGLATNLGLGVSFPFRERPLPYSHQYSAGFQYELPWRIRADVSYVGNQTFKLPISANINVIPADQLGRPASYYSEQVANPMRGLLPSSAAKNGATIARQELLLPFPHFAGVTATNIPIASQRYDAMQSSFVRRFANGFSLAVNFTISKTLERASFLNVQDFNLANPEASKLEKRLVDYDAPRHLGVLWSYDLPFGRGRKWAGGLHPAANFLLGGWNLAGNYNKRAGPPLDFPNAAPLEARSAKLSAGERDELARKMGKPRYDVSYVPYFDTSLFPRVAGPAPFTLRTFPTRFPDVRGFGLNNLDFTMAKQFAVTERIRFEYRADLLNALNTTYFRRLDSNGNNVTNANFGLIRQDPTVNARIIVMVLRLTF